MAKVESLKGTKANPKVFLTKLFEKHPKITEIVVLYEDEEGLGVAFNDVDLQTMSFLKDLLQAEITLRIIQGADA